MKIFANENLFEPIIDYLRSLGHDVLSIRDAGLSGISDDEVYQRACKENRVIVTMDKDFSRMFRFSPEKCGGGGLLLSKFINTLLTKHFQCLRSFTNQYRKRIWLKIWLLLRHKVLG
ncbi:MAG: DUF5615 family PIN-like protein [Nitrospirota bacterium]